MFQDFGALDINEDAEYVHGGARSLELRPASDGKTDALMYFPFESFVLGFDYKNRRQDQRGPLLVLCAKTNDGSGRFVFYRRCG